MARSLRNIVVATDFSPGSRAALGVVQRLGVRGLRVSLVHAIDPPAFSTGVPEPVWTDVLAQVEVAARRELERFVKRTASALGRGARVSGHLVHGPPADAICRLADRVRADLIVLGTHGRTGLSHLVLGSVAERVVRHAGRPVLTVPMARPRRR